MKTLSNDVVNAGLEPRSGPLRPSVLQGQHREPRVLRDGVQEHLAVPCSADASTVLA
jgi:hypothetical protein